MDPNQFQRNNLTDMDYLNQISSKPPSKFSFGGFNPKLVIGAGIFLVVIIIMAVITVVLNNKPDSASTTLSAKVAGLETILKYGEDNGDSFDSAINNAVSELRITTNSAKVELKNLVQMPAKPTKEALAQEKLDEVTTYLDSVKTTAQLDEDYIEALRSKVDEVIVSLEVNLREVKKSSTKAGLQEIIDNYKELNSRLESL